MINVTCENCGKVRTYSQAEQRNRPLKHCKDCKRFAPMTHGESHTRLYKLWASMKRRCDTPSDTNYYRYGARGIRVCTQWHRYEPFRSWAILNGYKEDLSIDRIDGTRGYSPDNCRWATRTEQNRNQKSNKLTLEKANKIRELYKNRKASARNIAKIYNIDRSLVYYIVKNQVWKN